MNFLEVEAIENIRDTIHPTETSQNKTEYHLPQQKHLLSLRQRLGLEKNITICLSHLARSTI